MNRKDIVDEIVRRVTEALGKGGGREGKGGAENCTCPNKKCSEYGKPVAHKRGTPCNTLSCAKCGSALTGLGAPKGKVKEVVGEVSEQDKKRQQKRAKACGIAVKDGGNVTMPAKWRKLGVPDKADAWLDWGNYKYPVADRKHIIAAAVYLAHKDNQKIYSSAEFGKMRAHLQRKRKQFKVGEFKKEDIGEYMRAAAGYFEGGAGSGHWGHKGRKGRKGGSASGGGTGVVRGGVINMARYRKLTDSAKEGVLSRVTRAYSEKYVRIGQMKGVSGEATALNKKVGAFEGIRRAFLNKAKALTGKQKRGVLHACVNLQSRAVAAASSRDSLLAKAT